MKLFGCRPLFKAGALFVVWFMVCPLIANIVLMIWLHRVEGKPWENINEDGRMILATAIGLAFGFVLVLAVAVYEIAKISRKRGD